MMKIALEHVTRHFIANGKKLEVLSDITSEIRQRDFICILGPNGCGKTTLLKILAGIITPSSGTLRCENGTPCCVSAALIFQEHGLFPWLNVIDNVCFGLEMRGEPRKERYRKAEGYLAKMGLSAFAGYYPHQLSGGMKQKANLIRGLLTDASVLLVDEPNTHLDAYTKWVVQKDIVRVWKEFGRTVVYVSHELEDTLALATRIWVISKSPARIVREFDLAPLRSEALSREEREMRQGQLKEELERLIEEEALRIPPC